MAPLELGRNYKSLVLTDRGLREGHWWIVLTNLFLHQDFEHLFSNAHTLVLNGFSAFEELGPQGFYAVFFASGAASALNAWGRAKQTQAQLEGTIPRAPEHIGPVPVPEGARAMWDSLRQGTARHAAPALQRRTEAFGASGAVCGLLGYGAGAALLRIGGWAAPPAAGARHVPLEERLAGGGPRSLGGWMALLNLAQSGNFLLNEWRSARGEEGFTGIDHAGHLTGFVAGVAFSLLAAGARWLHKRGRREPPPFVGGGQGRRLGGGGPQPRE